MKKLLVIMLTLGLASGVAAQGKIRGDVRYYRQRAPIVRVVPVSPFYNPYYGMGYRYSPYYSPFNSPFNDPFYNYRRAESRPSQLDLQIEDIENEYDHKLDLVKDDKSLSKDERKQKIRDLKYDRDDAIIEAKKNYYKSEKSSNE